MNNRYMVSNVQFILLLMTAIGLKNHVILIPPLIREAGRDAWISVAIVFLATIIWGILIFYIYKTMDGQHIHTWLREYIGNVPTNIFMIVISLYLISMAGVTLKETILWTNVSYLLETPPLVLTVLFVIPCMIASLTSFRTIIITNFFFLFFVIIFGFFVAITNIQFKDYSLLLPTLEHGWKPVLKATVYQGSGMVEIIVILFFQHKFKSKLRFWHYIATAVILTWLTLGPLIGAIIEFGPTEAASQRYPAYEEWGLARLGKYVEHVDYLSIYQWLSGAFIRITILLFTMRILLNRESKNANRWIVIGATTLIIAFVAIPLDEKMFFNLLLNLFLPITLWLLLACSIVFGVIAMISRRKQRMNENVQKK